MIHTYEAELVLQNQSKIPASRVDPLLLKLILVHRTIGKTAPMLSLLVLPNCPLSMNAVPFLTFKNRFLYSIQRILSTFLPNNKTQR